MSYSVIRLEHLDRLNASNIEGRNTLAEQELLKLAGAGQSASLFKAQLERGELFLMTDSPQCPLFELDSGELVVTSSSEVSLPPEAIEKAKGRLSSKRHAVAVPQSGESLSPAIEPEYSPEPVVDDTKASELAYRYNVEIACSMEHRSKYLPGFFKLGKVENEEGTHELKQEVIHNDNTLLFTELTLSDKRKLFYIPQGSVSSNLTTGLQVEPVVGTANKLAKEAFIPVTPAVQVGDRLAFPTKGYFYHFRGKKLTQELKIVEGCTFKITASYDKALSDVELIKKDSEYLVLYWRINGKKVTDQYVLYKDKKLTAEELSVIDTKWLDENALAVDPDKILTERKSAVLTFDDPSKPAQQPQDVQRQENACYIAKSRIGRNVQNIARSQIRADVMLINTAKICPDCCKAKECKVDIDYEFIKEREGFILTANVPNAGGSTSGVTIASGFDLGCRNVRDLNQLGLSASLVKKLKPYLGKKSKTASDYLKKNPLTVELSEANSINMKVKKESTNALLKKYNKASKVKFACLPKEAQTVIASVFYQYKYKLVKYKFWKQVVVQDWSAAHSNLLNFEDSYRTRRKAEAKILKRIL